jgi:tetratricopeptide (TPR) repeat protein
MFTVAPPFSYSFRVLLLAAFFAAGLAPARADEKPRPELSEATSEKLQDLKALEDADKMDEAMAVIDSLLLTAGPTSYDRAVLARIKANYLFRKNDRFGALDFLETALNLSDTYGYFDSKDTQLLRFYIANLLYERGSTTNDLDARRTDYNAARANIEKWLEISQTDPTFVPPAADSVANAEIFYASLLYTMGAELDSKHVDLDLVKKALAEAEKGLRSNARPNENLYVIKLAALQQLGTYADTASNNADKTGNHAEAASYRDEAASKYADAADVLEHILKSKPDNKSYWQQLTAFYAVLANDAETAKDDKKTFEYNVRAIVTIERGHKYGTLNKPEDNMELFSLYFNIGQYQQAAELLETGLHDGTIKSSQKNWVLLADAYQQLHKDMKAVAVLQEAAKLFPEEGQFDFLAAQILYGLNKTADALASIQSCVAKGGGDKKSQSWLFFAYLAFELQKFELAGQAVEHAAQYPEANATEISHLREAVQSAIAQRDSAFQRTK